MNMAKAFGSALGVFEPRTFRHAQAGRDDCDGSWAVPGHPSCRDSPVVLLFRHFAATGGASMRWKRRQRNAVAAWLGLFALGLQALVPLLVAAEITVAGKAGDHSVFELCLFGHPHGAAPSDAAGAPGSADQHHTDHGDLCPICIALHASPLFTAPAAAPLPLPALEDVAPVLTPRHGALRLLALAAYRSRAPPNG
jgi:hypothetical protein